MHTAVDGATIRKSVALPALAGLRVHLIGVGGAGMSGAAALLLEAGATVSGSDLLPFEGMGELVAGGARIAIGHREEQLRPDVDLVVISAAIPPDNPELALARARGLRVIKYAELLGGLMATRKGIAIAGTHGKSTTTAMTVHVFRHAGLDPSFILGAKSAQTNGGSGYGRGPHFIAESCEYDRSFLHLHPSCAAILNIEADHLDCYPDLEHVVAAFAEFAAQVHPEGLLICNGDDPSVMQAAGASTARVQTFGFDGDADWCAADVRSEGGRFAFDVRFRGDRMLSTELSIPGEHNVANALAATALAFHAGADAQAIAEALASFSGVGRRLTWRGENDGVTIVDDYAHHPTEIRVTLEAARGRYQPKRMWVVFQPHQYARTCHFMDEFARSFALANEVIVPDIYGARESDARACSAGSQELASRICKLGGHARYMASLDKVAGHLVERVADGDLVITMGAGDVWKVADELVARICRPDRA